MLHGPNARKKYSITSKKKKKKKKEKRKKKNITLNKVAVLTLGSLF